MDAMKILHLLDSLDGGDCTRQLQLLGPALTTRGKVHVCCLGRDTPWSAPLRQAGIIVNALGWTRWFDPGALWNLRRQLRESAPDVIHVWHLPALRALAVVAPGLLPRVVMSAALPDANKLAWWDRRLLENGLCRASVDVVMSEPERRKESFAGRAARIVCVGPLERECGIRQAIWAFDFLLLFYHDAQLQIAGSGSELAALQALAHGLGSHANVAFPGSLPDISGVLQDADIVWVPSLANRGRQIALEAMALGKAVVASDVPCLREAIRDGVTGFLVPAGDVIALARRTHALLGDQPLREKIGAAARHEAQQRFSVSDAAERLSSVYRSIAA
jgi:glycosyltransferase involved in cell wall biosynthesis